MNIFVLDYDPNIAAQMVCNAHFKMILESAQLLCSPYSVAQGAPYKRTHYNHPSAIWTRTSKQNYEWLINHAYALADEHTRAYKKVHKSVLVVDWCVENYSKLNLPDIGQTPFPLCMPEQYKVKGDPVQSYRNFYKYDKVRFAKWTHGRNPPDWW